MGAGQKILGAPRGGEGVKVGVDDGAVGANLDALANLNAFGGDQGDAGKATVIANRDDGPRLARGQHHGVVGRQGIAGRPGAECHPIPHPNGAAAYCLHHWRPQPATAPPPNNAVGAQEQMEIGQEQQPPHFVGDTSRRFERQGQAVALELGSEVRSAARRCVSSCLHTCYRLNRFQALLPFGFPNLGIDIKAEPEAL